MSKLSLKHNTFLTLLLEAPMRSNMYISETMKIDANWEKNNLGLETYRNKLGKILMRLCWSNLCNREKKNSMCNGPNENGWS